MGQKIVMRQVMPFLPPLPFIETDNVPLQQVQSYGMRDVPNTSSQIPIGQLDMGKVVVDGVGYRFFGTQPDGKSVVYTMSLDMSMQIGGSGFLSYDYRLPSMKIRAPTDRDLVLHVSTRYISNTLAVSQGSNPVMAQRNVVINLSRGSETVLAMRLMSNSVDLLTSVVIS